MYQLPPCMTVLSGPPLVGKSYLAEGLIQESNFVHLDVDEIRQELYPNPERKLFSEHWERFIMAACYMRLAMDALAVLEVRSPVVVTDTFPGTNSRRHWNSFPEPLLKNQFLSMCSFSPHLTRKSSGGSPSACRREVLPISLRWSGTSERRVSLRPLHSCRLSRLIRSTDARTALPK